MVRSPCEEEDPCMVRSLWRQEELVPGPHVGVGGGMAGDGVEVGLEEVGGS